MTTNASLVPSGSTSLEPSRAELFTALADIGRYAGLEFRPASLADQMLIQMPGGHMLPDGKLLLGDAAAMVQRNFFQAAHDSTHAALSASPAHTIRPMDGAPMECRLATINDGVVLGIEIGLTNIVRRDLPTFVLSVASRDGFSMEQIERIVGDTDPQWTLLLQQQDITYLTKPNARLVLTPQSQAECAGIVARIVEVFGKSPVASEVLDVPALPPAEKS